MIFRIELRKTSKGYQRILTEVEKNLKGGTKGYFLSLIHEKCMWLLYLRTKHSPYGVTRTRVVFGMKMSTFINTSTNCVP